ncbi:MAG: RNA-directed DNA polymerase [Hellea sp.]
MKIDNLFTPKRMKGLWKSMLDSEVPLVTLSDKALLETTLKTLEINIKSNNYLPSVPHGYLGMAKGQGVTRFIPILSKEDLLTYYSLTLSLQDFLVENIKGVYGAYLVVPKKAKKEVKYFEKHKNLPIEGQDVAMDFEWGSGFNFSLKKSAWIKDWKQYIEFLETAITEVPSHYKLITTDIANFYDTINVDKLSEKLSRRLAKQDAEEPYFDVKDLLITFLRYWDRRLNGYQPSSKGIPQEIISDASRLLANFYLINFDVEFSLYCKNNNLKYARWADDIVVFGSSPKKLEIAIHAASKILLKDGLNLNSSKTNVYSKGEYREYRAMDTIGVLNKNEPAKADKRIKLHMNNLNKGKEIRNDTVFKRVISFTASNKGYQFSAAYQSYIEICSEDYSLVSTLKSNQMLNLVLINDYPDKAFSHLLKMVTNRPYASPKASFLKMVWKGKNSFLNSGIKFKTLVSSIDRIEKTSKDSTIIQDICVPEARIRLKAL